MGRIEFDVISCALPLVTRSAQHVLYLKRLMRVQAETIQGKLNPTGLLVTKIEIDDCEDDAGTVVGSLRVGNDLIVIDGMKRKVPIALERGIIAPDLIHPRDQVAQAVGMVDGPGANLVFFRVPIFLAPSRYGAILAQFEGRAVDAIVRPQSGG